MAVFFLTNSVLDVVWGATWWTMKKTYNGLYYVIYGDPDEPTTIEISPEDVTQNKELLDKLLEKTAQQESEIKKLTDNIEILTNYMKAKDE
jgi:hypothetical protein